jgi:hypothetical protein
MRIMPQTSPEKVRCALYQPWRRCDVPYTSPKKVR